MWQIQCRAKSSQSGDERGTMIPAGEWTSDGMVEKSLYCFEDQSEAERIADILPTLGSDWRAYDYRVIPVGQISGPNSEKTAH